MAASLADDSRSRPAPIRAPQVSGELAARPRLDRAGGALRANELLLGSVDRMDLQGRSLAALRAQTRELARQLAQDYTYGVTGAALDVAPGGPLFVTGHQPVLCHPGVWAKHFAAAGLARRHGGYGLNLVVDNDLLLTTAASVPRGPQESPHVEPFRWLAPQPPRPWEEVQIGDARLFETFGERVAAAMQSDWGIEPLVRSCWRDAVAARQSHPQPADCLTAMRARQERRMSISNLELPLSRLEETEPFRWFLCHALVQAGRLRDIHNEELAAYRRRNRIRSRSHPVPELRERDGWIEAPFWVWRTGATQRQSLFVRPLKRRVELACGGDKLGELRLHPESDAASGVEDLSQLATSGWKIRTRALTTTLFARLCLADLFIHGIGGAKYDELTDRLIERFYGLTPPAFLTLTATLHLPLGAFAATAADVRTLRQQLRDVRFNPERHLSGPAAESARQRKQRLIADRQHERSERRRLHLELQALQTELQPQAAAQRAHLETLLGEATARAAANRILTGREFAWCLFPEDAVQALLEGIVSACG